MWRHGLRTVEAIEQRRAMTALNWQVRAVWSQQARHLKMAAAITAVAGHHQHRETDGNPRPSRTTPAGMRRILDGRVAALLYYAVTLHWLSPGCGCRSESVYKCRRV
jgi:hypothetical protein